MQRVWRISRLLGAALVLLLMAMLGSWLSLRNGQIPTGLQTEAGSAPLAEAQSPIPEAEQPAGKQPPAEPPSAEPPSSEVTVAAGPASAPAPGPAPVPALTTPAPTPSSAAPVEGASPVAGTWSGNVHSQRATLVLAGRDETLEGRLTLKHPTTGVARTVSVRGSFDEATGRLELTEEVDPLVDPTAGRYDANLSADRSTVTGKYHAMSGDRTATIALRRSGG